MSEPIDERADRLARTILLGLGAKVVAELGAEAKQSLRDTIPMAAFFPNSEPDASEVWAKTIDRVIEISRNLS